MSSLKRILASRANGRRSLGPVTATGRQKASQNALSHGLLARCLVLNDESPEAFETLLSHRIERDQAADPVEFGFVEEMVGAALRMRRAWAIETRMLDTNSSDPSEAPPVDRMSTAFPSLANTAALPLMHRYETRLHMLYQRALHNVLLVRGRHYQTNLVPFPNSQPSCWKKLVRKQYDKMKIPRRATTTLISWPPLTAESAVPL
jgi:hypothetical protein